MSIKVDSLYYNHYDVKEHYSPKTPQTPSWKKLYEVVDDRVKSNNENPESGIYKAHCKLEETYYHSSVSNRARYKDADLLKQALGEKYLFGDAYKNYSYEQRRAMYENELNMTMYGTCGNMNDPHLDGPVKGSTASEQATYNRKMINTQISAILSNAGLDASMLGNMTFSIEPFNHTLSVFGLDEKTNSIVEQLLNSDNNSIELFYHVMQSNRSLIDESVMDKYRAIHDFKEVTGEDLRKYLQTKDGFVDEKGCNALDVYKKALETTDSIPSQFKKVAFEVFSSNLNALMEKEFATIPDMNLQIGFSNGELQDSIFNTDIVKRLNSHI